MAIEIEHAAGSSPEQIKAAEMDFRKNALAHRLGWTREHFDEQLEDVKDFLTMARKEKSDY